MLIIQYLEERTKNYKIISAVFIKKKKKRGRKMLEFTRILTMADDMK